LVMINEIPIWISFELFSFDFLLNLSIVL
jgi:hypothetical protein